jgi:hypothetical protein
MGKTRIYIRGKRYPDDCTGLVRAVFDEVGINLFADARRGDNGVGAIYHFARTHGRIYTGGRPVAGDLVFFRDTYNRRGSSLTHVGVVEKVEEDRTVWVIHRVRRGVVRYRMNLEMPDARVDRSGHVLNDYLRKASPGHGQVLTGQLFAAYATILPVDERPKRLSTDQAAPVPGSSASASLESLRAALR